MAKTYTYSQARQNLASVLDQVESDGEVVITRRDGRRFVIRPAEADRSPLDVPAIKSGLSREEIVSSIREGRELDKYSVSPKK
jgi:prevent-host-death family protein